MGASILMGIQYGAKDYKTLHRQISTTMLSGVVFSFFLTLLCVVFAVPILHLLQVDASIMEMTRQYLRIIFLGLMFTFLYNFFSSTLRALGDSASPLYFLIISAVLNIFGDLFFVIVLKAGSNGCAISTVLSEALCCLFCIIYIQKKVPILRLGKKWLVFDSRLLKKTIAYGWASAMQQATVQMGKLRSRCWLILWSLGNSYVILNGLREGEEIVTNGVFAIDASAQLEGKTSMMNNGDEPAKPMTGHEGHMMHAQSATGVASEHAMFGVKGSCDMCKERIEKAAKGVKGVLSAHWDKDTQMIHLQYDPKKTSPKAISKAIAKVGHDTDMDKADKAVYDKLPACCHYR